MNKCGLSDSKEYLHFLISRKNLSHLCRSRRYWNLLNISSRCVLCVFIFTSSPPPSPQSSASSTSRGFIPPPGTLETCWPHVRRRQVAVSRPGQRRVRIWQDCNPAKIKTLLQTLNRWGHTESLVLQHLPLSIQKQYFTMELCQRRISSTFQVQLQWKFWF